MLPDAISISQINQYLMCPRKYSFRYVYGYEPEFRPAALAFGTSVHAAIAWFNQALKDGETPSPETMIDVFEADWEASQADPIRFKDDGEAKKLLQQGSTLLALYAGRMSDLEPRAVEQRFEVPLTNPATGELLSSVPMIGYIDCLDVHGVLYEFKTSARAFDDLTARKQLQLTAYTYALRMQDQLPRKLVILALLKQKRPRIQVVFTERDPEDEYWFVTLAVEVIEAIDAMVFPPNPNQVWLCAGCEYRQRCSRMRVAEPSVRVA